MAELDSGIFQIGPDISGGEAQRVFLDRLRKVALDSGRPIMFGTLATKQGVDPNPWDYQLRWIDETVAQGGRIWGQATTRSINAIFSLKSYLPFDYLPGWRELRALPLDEQKARLRDPGDARAAGRRGSADEAEGHRRCRAAARRRPTRASPITPICSRCSTSDWDDPSVAELARRRNQHPVEMIIDLCLENDNRVFVQPLVNELPDDVLGLLKHPRTLATFSDSGAHVCQEMGSSLQTHLLSYWVRKRQQFTLEEAVRMLTFDNASAWELPDRGLRPHRLRRRSRRVRRSAHPAAAADGRAGSAGRRAPPGAEGRRHRRDDGQRRRRVRERRGDREYAGRVLKGRLAAQADPARKLRRVDGGATSAWSYSRRLRHANRRHRRSPDRIWRGWSTVRRAARVLSSPKTANRWSRSCRSMRRRPGR